MHPYGKRAETIRAECRADICHVSRDMMVVSLARIQNGNHALCCKILLRKHEFGLSLVAVQKSDVRMMVFETY